MTDVSVIIVNWNTRQLLADCLDSLIKTADGLSLEYIVVDNGSTDGSQAMLAERYPQVRLMANQENVGFGRANNQGMDVARGRYVLLFNSDALATSGFLQRLVALADANPKVGMVGAHLLNQDGSFQASHTRFPTLWREFLILSGLGRKLHGYYFPSHGPDEDKGQQKVDYVEGACMLVRLAAYRQAGGFDPAFFMYAEEVDWCYSFQKAGWEIWYDPDAKVIHLGGGSSGSRRTSREADLYQGRVRFFRKHYGDAAANLLKLQIYTFTLVKIITHRVLKLVTGGRRGREVVSLSYLATKLREV